MGIVVFSYAAERFESKPFNQVKPVLVVPEAVHSASPGETGNYFDCTMSATATVSVGVAKFEVSCTATGADCTQALSTAEGCVSAVIRRIKAAIK